MEDQQQPAEQKMIPATLIPDDGIGPGVLGFAWALLLLGTVAAAETDQPMLWLLVGPAPFLVGFVLVVSLRQRFKSFSWQLPVVRKENEGPVGMAPN